MILLHIDGLIHLKSFTDKEIKENYASAYNNKEYLYPYNTPQTTEAFYYRQIFEKLYPNREKTVKYWRPNTTWKGLILLTQVVV